MLSCAVLRSGDHGRSHFDLMTSAFKKANLQIKQKHECDEQTVAHGLWQRQANEHVKLLDALCIP